MPENHRVANPLGGEQGVDLVARAGETNDAELHFVSGPTAGSSPAIS